jgi:hypothetical protein
MRMTENEEQMTSQERERVLVASAVAMIKQGQAQGIPVKDMVACFKGQAHGAVALEAVLKGLA